ncbi:hypothetical protein [Flavobacterium collinsii]|uniref:hypothetical protein n=1 Tax=Flavobacterium collinsii TaxID=1114861 RepID=UPI0024930EDF|nr:hypothetical protein [Flavobacterium collinsii]
MVKELLRELITLRVLFVTDILLLAEYYAKVSFLSASIFYSLQKKWMGVRGTDILYLVEYPTKVSSVNASAFY